MLMKVSTTHGLKWGVKQTKKGEEEGRGLIGQKSMPMSQVRDHVIITSREVFQIVSFVWFDVSSHSLVSPKETGSLFAGQ